MDGGVVLSVLTALMWYLWVLGWGEEGGVGVFRGLGRLFGVWLEASVEGRGFGRLCFLWERLCRS